MILITGATGTNGREIARLLSKAGVPVRALVRSAKSAAGLQLPGIQPVIGDFGDPASLKAALAGVERALLLTPFVEDQRPLQAAFIDTARRAGVRHVVKFSCMGADAASITSIFRQHGEGERLLEGSGMAWTHLRPNSFMQNFLGSAATIAQGALYAPMDESRVSFVDARDIAAVAVAALTQPGHEGKAYEITGSESLSHVEVAATLTATLERKVEFVTVSPGQFRESMLQFSLPAWAADGLNELYAAYRRGEGATVTDAVRQITGRGPITFEQFAREHVPSLTGVK
jgi:uncharacterized protein YbjT (DUF2867 family)